jgi:methylated-DNA-[protein]-cysteine S-methyltransferase
MKSSNTYYFSAFQTAVGTFSLAVDAKGAVVASAFGGRKALMSRLKDGMLASDTKRTAAARAEVLDWFHGKRRDFSVTLAPSGSPFQKKVWAALRRIPFGTTRSYGDIARAIGSAPRAVGRANATNPICVIVPCHRVIGTDGSLTGFAFGEGIKRRLIAFEAA